MAGKAWRGLVCPANPDHGPVYGIELDGRTMWHCPHQTHQDARSGKTERHLFTLDEVEKGALSDGPSGSSTGV